ncbi:MAG: twin-arginine translocation signal domain-containing protein, partial [Candidatus Omnitrophica bacterium]|nr:twin-arginine translocation signal domain-containing protein [Candidatus Omnitrophota bacterium]
MIRRTGPDPAPSLSPSTLPLPWSLRCLDQGGRVLQSRIQRRFSMKSISRRNFISKSAVAAVGAGLAGQAVTALAEDAKVSANDKISVALIGCGGQGRADLNAF